MKIGVGPELIEIAKLAYKADKPMLLIGSTGVGKSETLAQAAKELGIKYKDIDLSIVEAPDLTGLPFRDGGRTRFAPPAGLPSRGTGILVFEELNRAPRYTQAPCLQLLTARKLNDYKLPKGWVPMAAVNPDEEGYLVEAMDKALTARFIVVHVEADVQSWTEWAARSGVHLAVVKFVNETPNIFQAAQSNPRAWKYISDVVAANETLGLKKRTLQTAVAGLVGDRLAGAFMATYKSNGGLGAVSVDAVMRSYATVQAAVRKWVKKGDTARLNSLVRSLLLHLQAPTNEHHARESSTARANLTKLVGDFPAAFRRMVVANHAWLKPACRAHKTKRKGR